MCHSLVVSKIVVLQEGSLGVEGKGGINQSFKNNISDNYYIGLQTSERVTSNFCHTINISKERLYNKSSLAQFLFKIILLNCCKVFIISIYIYILCLNLLNGY